MRRVLPAATVAALAGLVLAGCGGEGDSRDGDGDGRDGDGVTRRIDTATPAFTTPTAVTNPLFPVQQEGQTIQLGDEEGEPLRVEVTTLPRTITVRWADQEIEAAVAQYVAYRSGRIIEVALDYYAQDDEGGVWYLGETVDNYADGGVADHEGSWLAGADGPAGLIMPADPREGDVFRPENIPGLVFEEVTVQAVGQTADGPRGPVAGAIRTEEHLMDGAVEHKVFAPGYGEFRAEAPDELVEVVVAVPADAVEGVDVPVALRDVVTAAMGIVDTLGAGDEVTAGDWAAVRDEAAATAAGWRAGRPPNAPRGLADRLGEALDTVVGGAGDGDAAGTRRAALDAVTAALDLTLVYRPPAEVDVDRLGVVARQLLADAAESDRAGMLSDVSILEAIRDRVAHALDQVPAAALDQTLRALRAAAERADADAVAAEVSAVLEQVRAAG
ncbi:hypothetical protein [Jiangella asiatica]|uniref:PPIase cyclophilin-type domain-containing protein n=1 Tax=Jiangella asiatica TaxID=2530372 RepID=A0A4R5DHT9_9ACTN|nr:hypothetical protein [Jiangella asiatica]TDE11500.1 hypothetical protein E1269_09580 [Jiangella asiatica]